MPYRIAIDSDRRLVVNPDGHCDLAASLAMLSELADHGRSGMVAGALLDLRGIDYIPTYCDVQTLAEEAGLAIRLPLALVVAGALQTGVARQFAVLADALGVRVGVFAEPAAAADWLAAEG
jgi:hypothetical protein